MDQKNVTTTAVAVASVAAIAMYLVVTKKLVKVKGGKRSLSNLVRRNVKDLQPYRCARDDYNAGILLDANENSVGPALEQTKVEMSLSSVSLNRYPDPYQLEVKMLLAKMRGVRHEQIFIGVGSDEAIDVLIRIFCRPGEDSIMVTPPTYGMYKVFAKVNDVSVREIPQTPDFQVVPSEILRAVTPDAKLLFLCSPGNPTGKSVPASVVRDIVKGGYDGIVVVDEAYVDFSEEESACSLIDELDRVVVVQTFSKGFGMAAMRMGMTFGSKEIIHYMNKVRAPYSINQLTQEVAAKALSDLTLFQKQIVFLRQERTKLQDALRRLSFVREVKESESNFFLFKVDKAYEIYQHMAENGVIVRFRGNELHCKDCLRVTVGTPEENKRFLALLQEAFASVSAAGGAPS